MKNSLKLIFIVDAIIAIGFGLYSWFSPLKTFGTILSVPEVGSSVFLAILSSLSLFYVLTGLTCLIGFKASAPVNSWIALLMIVRHLFEGIMKVFDIGEEWLIGNPYPDIIIHTVFIFAYLFAIYFTYMNNRAKNNSGN
ncbi:MAG: hypothetical protein ACRC3B_21075 [Bacteroidia bacterium]